MQRLKYMYSKKKLMDKLLQKNKDKISYKAGKNNTKLTDFSETKILVINNIVKNVPEMIKAKGIESNHPLNGFF
jgi:hypothetical protein